MSNNAEKNDVSGYLSDTKDPHEKKLAASATVYICTDSPFPADMPEEQRKDYLLTNALSMAYSHAKSHIIQLTSQSPAGAVIIPAILPAKIVEAQEDARADSE